MSSELNINENIDTSFISDDAFKNLNIKEIKERFLRGSINLIIILYEKIVNFEIERISNLTAMIKIMDEDICSNESLSKMSITDKTTLHSGLVKTKFQILNHLQDRLKSLPQDLELLKLIENERPKRNRESELDNETVTELREILFDIIKKRSEEKNGT